MTPTTITESPDTGNPGNYESPEVFEDFSDDSLDMEEPRESVLDEELDVTSQEEVEREHFVKALKEISPRTMFFIPSSWRELSLKQKFMLYFSSRSYCNETFSELAFYTLVSSLLYHRDPEGNVIGAHFFMDNTKHDLRVNTFLCQPTGTGKSQGLSVIKDIYDRLSERIVIASMVDRIDYRAPTRYTSAAIFGSYDRKKLYNKEERSYEEIRVPVYGELYYSTLFAAEEASRIILDTDYKKDIIHDLNVALDAYKEIAVTLFNTSEESEQLRYKCISSFCLISHPISFQLKRIWDTGFLQRFLFYPRDVDEELRIKMADRPIVTDEMRPVLNEILESIVDDLFSIKAYIDSIGDAQIFVSNDDAFLLREELKVIQEEYAQGSKEVRTTFQDCFGRYERHILAVAGVHALCDQRITISSSDLRDAIDLAKKVLDELVPWIELSGIGYRKVTLHEEPFMLATVREKFLSSFKTQPGEVDTTGMSELICQVLSCSSSTAYRHLKKSKFFLDSFQVVEGNERNKKIWRLKA